MVYRIYVEKKPGFDVEAEGLKKELTSLLGIQSLTGLRLLNRYDVEGIDEALFDQCIPTVFSEPPVDNTYAELPKDGGVSFAVEYLPGQFDQRADSAAECIQLISQGERPLVRSARVYLLQIMTACTNGTLADTEVRFSDGAAACVILASGGYPVQYEKGKPISGLTNGQLAGEENITVYHSGTAITEDGTLVTNGGRVLGVTATAPRLTAAVTQAYAAAEKISFEKLHKRTDIGLRALTAIAEG